MIKTRHNQTPFELAEEFIGKVRDSKTVSPVLVKLCDDWAKLETGEVPMEPDVAERIQHQIAHAGSNPKSILDTRQIAFYKNCKPNISDVFLAWIAGQCEGSPEYLNTVLGCYSTYFYKFNPRSAQLTLAWVNSIVGSGKVFDLPNITRWYLASKVDAERSIFEVITENDLYVYQDPTADR